MACERYGGLLSSIAYYYEMAMPMPLNHWSLQGGKQSMLRWKSF